MILRPGSFRAWIHDLNPEQQARTVSVLTLEEARSADGDWLSWAHEGQEPPPSCADGSDWRTWVLMAGRGFGKTLAGAQWITAAIAAGAPLRIALVGATLDEARRVMVEGKSGLLEVADAWVTDWQPSLRRLRFRGGAEATLFSGASPEQLRGPEHDLAWCDELAKWEKPGETWDMLQLGLRLGPRPRVLVTTTPRPGPHLRRIMAAPGTIVTGGPTRANPHLPDAYVDAVEELYAGTRLGRQELDGELLADTPGALWTVELIERCRIQAGPSARPERGALRVGEGRVAQAPQERPSTTAFGLRSGRAEALLPAARPSTTAFGLRSGRAETLLPAARPSTTASGLRSGRAEALLPAARPSTTAFGLGSGRAEALFPAPGESATFTRVLIAVDPPAGEGTCGIVACARDRAGIAHVLADHSVTGRSPEGWARAVADAARIHGAQLVVAEKNQGGAMVAAVLRTAEPSLRVRLVAATVGKSERAAPVAMLFEAGKVLLHGRFPELEAELLGMIAGGNYEGPGTSPDRADAMVWGLTELMLEKERAEPRIRLL